MDEKSIKENINNKFVYFNIVKSKTKKYNLYLSSEYDQNSLEKIEEKDLPEKEDISEVYRIKILPQKIQKKKNSYNIEVIIEEDNGHQHKYIIRLNDIDKDFYEYNFKMEGIDIIPLSYEQQFEIYLDILRTKYHKNQKTQENYDFIESTQLLLEKSNKYNFSLYLLIFLQCFSTPLLQKHMLIFNPKKIKGIGDIPEKILKQTKNILNTILKNPEEKLHITEEGLKRQTLELYLSVVLYFNLNYQKENIRQMFENEKFFNYLYEKLVYYHQFFKDLILPKEDVIKLIDQAKNFNQIQNFLFYLDRDFLTFMQIINGQNKKINTIINQELNENQKKDNFMIEVLKYIDPKKEDDIISITSEINEYFGLNGENVYLKFSDLIFKKYVLFYKDKNYENLLLLNTICSSIKNYIHNFETKCKFDDVIHGTGLKLILEGKIKNLDVLDFLSKDEYYHKKEYISKRSLDIFNGIDITSLNEKFFKEWRAINFKSMFNKKLDEFLRKISSLIKEMKDFRLLFSFFKFYQEKGIDDSCILIMQDKFIDLYPTYKENECSNFIKDISKLLYLSSKCRNFKDFNDRIQKIMYYKTVNNIYIYITEKYPDLSKDFLDIILKFFIEDKNNSNPSSLVYLIEKCKKLRKEIFSRINKYVMKEEEIFSLEESENYKFFKDLLIRGLINQKEYKKGDYIDNTLKIVLSEQEKIKNLQINYKNINFFLDDKKLEVILLERILYIFLMDEHKPKQYFDLMKAKVNEVKGKIENFQIVFKYFNDFLSSKIYDIEKLLQIITTLCNNHLYFFEQNYVNDYNNYEKYLNEAKKFQKYQESLFFNEIYKEIKNKYKDIDKNKDKDNDSDNGNDKKCLEESEKLFKELQKIFIENGINKIDEKILEIILKPFNGKEKDIEKEINILKKIFEINQDMNINNTIEQMILISKREYMINAAKSIDFFIEQIKGIKTKFISDIRAIIKSLNEKKDFNTIRICKNIFNNIKIDIIGGDNTYIDIIIKLKIQPDIISFLFKKTVQDCRNLQEISSQNENSFVSVNDILDMEKCVEFFNNFGKLEDFQNKNDSEIINLFKENVDKKKDILLYFEKFVDNYGQIKVLESSLDKSQVLKNQIEKIINDSTFILSNTKNDSFKFDHKLKNVESTLEYIISLRERAQLIKKKSSEYKSFIESINQILNIHKLLHNIYMKGYPKIFEVKIKFSSNFKNNIGGNSDEIGKKYFLNDVEKKDNIQIENKIKINLKFLREKQIKAYKERPLIRYIYGNQFNYLYQNIKTINNTSINNIKPFLKYITNDLYTHDITNFKVKEEGNIIDNNINECEKYLNEVLKQNNLNLKMIYESTIIKKNVKNEKVQGVYIYLCINMERDLFKIYKYLTCNAPIAQNILICDKDTISEEITAFLYRAILCEYNSCFIIGGMESLNNEQKIYIIDLLNQLFPKGDEKIKSCLIILYQNKNSDVYKNLNTKKYINILGLESQDYINEKYDGNDIEIIKSDKSGVGKTTQIKKEIEDAHKKWIYFPTGGVFNRNDILERLKDNRIDNTCILHLDLYNTDKIKSMLDFLFSLLITRVFGKNEDIFYLSKDIKIKVEIPNTFIDFFLKFPILTLFNIKEMKISNLPFLIVPEELDSNIQIIANYLNCQQKDEINNYDLIIPKVTPKDFENRTIEFKKSKKKVCISKNATKLSQIICQKLIFNVIKENVVEPNYYQITSFINVLAVQLKKFNQNFFLSAYQLLTAGGTNNTKIRNFIVECFIKLTKHFTEGAFTDLLKNQKLVHDNLFGQYNENVDINKAINNLSKTAHKEVSFDEINPFLLFFHEGNGQLFSIITNKNTSQEESNNLLKLINSQVIKKEERLSQLPDYKNYNQEQFLEELKKILDINTSLEKLKEISGNYVFTADNFIKMVLILLRIRSNIPVIMMGETGCGKTSLIRKLSELKNDGKKNKMKILNIHAGTNDNDIINFIKNEIYPESIKLIMEENIEKKNYEDIGLIFEESKFWVFLDEINTCKSMGLISELLCKHSYLGYPLPSNVVFIAACNPYRQIQKNVNEKKIGLDIIQAKKEQKLLNELDIENIKKQKNNNLVYSVNPLPHSLLNFVFDFGNLNSKDEENYIKCIINESIEKIYKIYKPQKEINSNEILEKLKQLASEMIIEAQNFIREFNDKSSVSLREIRRFNIFYEFFCDYLKRRKEIIKQTQNETTSNEAKFYIYLDNYNLQVYSINLSIFICYYLRIIDKNKRKELNGRMNKIFKKYENYFIIKDFLELPLKEEKFIIDSIDIDKGIAKNRALLENIFSLFVAINCKVPIFIVGKPGCSKSLSVQLILKSMQGNSSKNLFFKSLPKIMVYSYQGSLASTSKGVENIFSKVRNAYQSLSKEDKEKNICLLFFDEMGLAEHSPNNPLKVIHAELEYDQNEGDKKIAFVGISNWALDAAKMNRGICISIPEPDEEDIKNTSLTIANSYDKNLDNKYKIFFENLGEAYFKYKEYLKEKHNSDGKEDFHGNRDFYHLIKNASKLLIKNENISLQECAFISIERNFSGLQFENGKNSLEIIKEKFIKNNIEITMKKEYNVLQRIKDNINDLDSRYLLVISKSSLSNYLLSSILVDEDKDYNFYIGSQFPLDLKSEEYTIKVLNKIQVHMESKNILILKNLESVYPSLYDLFNQNFRVVSNKNYARLAVGSSTNTFSYVDNNFRCIINVDNDKINEEEPPFLNRFEKHIISFEYLLSKELIKISEKIKIILDEMIQAYEGINYELKLLLINCKKDEIQALVYKANKESIKEEEDIIIFVLKKIALTLPQEILINMRINGFKQKYEKYFEVIVDSYGKGVHYNLSNFLKTINIKKNILNSINNNDYINNDNKFIIYTFSNILETINIEDIKTSLGIINSENIKQIVISSIKSEDELERKIEDIYSEEKNKICIFKLMPNEGCLMDYLKFFLENKEKEYTNKSRRVFIFIIYLSRILKDDLRNLSKMAVNEKNELQKKILNETLSNLSGFYQIFIDNLKGKNNIEIHKIIKMENPIDIFKCSLNVDQQLRDNIYNSMSYIDYNIKSNYKGINKNNYCNKLMEFIPKHKKLIYLMNECLLKQIKENEDIFINIFKEQIYLKKNYIDFLSIVEKYLIKKYVSQLNLFFFKAESESFFPSLLSNIEDFKQKEIDENKIKEKEDEIFEYNIFGKITKSYLESLVFNDGKTKITEVQKMNKVNIMLGLHIPGIKPIFDTILNYVRNDIIEKYRSNENTLRNNLRESEIEKEKDNYFNQLKEFNDDLKNLIYKEEKLVKIINDNQNDSKQIYDLIMDDYYTIFFDEILKNNNKNINIIKNGKKDDKINQVEKIYSIDNYKKILNLMVKLKINTIEKYIKEKKKDIIDKLSEAINWVESYKEEIMSISQIYLKLNLKINDIYEMIEDIIKNKEIKYEISPRNPEYTFIVNEVFFISLDSILRVITSKDEIYNLSSQNFFELNNTNEEVLQEAIQLEDNLILRSKEVFSLQELLKLNNVFLINKINHMENIKKIIKYFGLQTKYNNEEKKRALCDNFNDFYNFLVDSLGKENNNFNFYKVLNFVLFNEYMKISFDNFRELLLQKILDNNDFIKNSSQIIKFILENIIISNPNEFENNLEYLRDEDSVIFKKLNNTENSFLDEVIMNIFEGKICVYFESIKNCDNKELYPKFFKSKDKINETGIVFDISLEVFKETIKFLDSFSLKKTGENGNIHLCKLYSIVYVKKYLSEVVYFIKEKFNELGSIKEIINIIQNIKNKNFGNVIKIYVFKLFYNLMSNNYEQFKNYNYKSCGIEFYNDFPSLYRDKDEILLTYLMLPLEEDDFKNYLEELKMFEDIREKKFNTSTEQFSKLIKNNSFDIFLNLSINKIISNLGLKNYINDKDEYQNFSSFIKSLLSSSLEINSELKKLLFLFFDYDTFIGKMKPKLISLNGLTNPQIFEMILYGFRFCFNTLDKNEEDKEDGLLFESILKKDCINIISKSFIPGIDDVEDLHLMTLEDVNSHFSKYPDDYGCYICSCGYYYNIGPCGFPTEEIVFDCPNCGLKCGWGKKKIPARGTHGMNTRPGHYRIFKDKAQKEGQMELYDEPDANIPNKLLFQYKNEIIERIRNKSTYGFNQITNIFFQSKNKKIRNLSQIGYRLLNFVCYNYLFFSYCLDCISEENMNKYLIKNMNILEIIELDWNLLKESLQQKNISSIQIFMNMIFKKLAKLIKNCKILNTNLEREEFENKVEKLIEECIQDYTSYSNKYNKENKNQLGLNNLDIKTIVTGLAKVDEETYPESEFPMLKYFNLTKYKSKEDLLKLIDKKDNHPLLKQILLDIPEIYKMKYLPIFNEFTNFMVKNYSFKISRDDAKNKILENEEIYKNEEFKTKFKKFIKAWNEIKDYAIKYQCRPEMLVKDLSSKDPIIYFLNDDGELGYGMYLAAACQNFISWQNSFLQPIIDANTSNGILFSYINNIKKKIPVQNSKRRNIVLINERFSNSKYANINDIIYSFSHRNIFNGDGTINYYDYNSFIYDYDAIEEELGRIILPGVCQFEGEKELNFVAFWSEGFRGGRSEVLSSFYLKYPQKDLDKNEKEKVLNYIKKLMLENNYDFKEIFGSIQKLIFYLTDKDNVKVEEKVIKVLKDAPSYFKLSPEFLGFFSIEEFELACDKIMNLFFFIEHLCFEDLIKTLQNEYKEEIPEDLKIKIKDKLINKRKDFDLYTIKELGAAVRRFISRYLCGKSQVTDIKEDRDLSFELSREDLWEEKIAKLDDLMGIVHNQLGEFKLKVGQAYSFYKLIQEEDNNSILLMNSKNRENEDEFRDNEIDHY